MARCLARTAAKKRCANQARPGEVYCGVHIKERPRLTSEKCATLRWTKVSPISGKKLKRKGKSYQRIYAACRARAMKIAKRLAKTDSAEYQALAKKLKRQWVRNSQAKPIWD